MLHYSITRRSFRHIGADPFDPDRNKARIIQFSLDSIIHTLDLLDERKDDDRYAIEGTPVLSCNWDPYVYDKDGNKQRYQRPFVWKTSQKQALISSIYNGVDCGKVLVRERDYGDLMSTHAKGERELAFHDIVDGKQRMNAVREFILGKFKDVHGNKYADLSDNAQSNFLSHQLFSYCSLPHSTSDAEVLRQFLKLNFSGIPQSKAHMKYDEECERRPFERSPFAFVTVSPSPPYNKHAETKATHQAQGHQASQKDQDGPGDRAEIPAQRVAEDRIQGGPHPHHPILHRPKGWTHPHSGIASE